MEDTSLSCPISDATAKFTRMMPSPKPAPRITKTTSRTEIPRSAIPKRPITALSGLTTNHLRHFDAHNLHACRFDCNTMLLDCL